MPNIAQLFRGQNRNVLLLFFVGNPIGCAWGYLATALPNLLLQVNIANSKITNPIILGIAIALSVQIISVFMIFIWTSWDRHLYVPVTWLLLGISSGMLVSLTTIGGVLLATGFMLPYIVILLLPFIVVCFVGIDAISFLAVDALKLVVIYVAITLLDLLATAIAA